MLTTHELSSRKVLVHGRLGFLKACSVQSELLHWTVFFHSTQDDHALCEKLVAASVLIHCYTTEPGVPHKK